MNHRFWKGGTRIRNRHGNVATLLAPTWNGRAWVQYDGHPEGPVTEMATEFILDNPHDNQSKHCLVCERPRDGGAIWCADPACHELIRLIPMEVINKIREREAIAAFSGTGIGGAFIHVTPRD